MINAMQGVDMMFGALTAGLDSVSRSSVEFSQSQLLYKYNNLVDKYNELSKLSRQALGIMSENQEKIIRENKFLRNEIQKLQRQLQK